MSTPVTVQVPRPLEVQLQELLQKSAVDPATMESLVHDFEEVLIHAGVLHTC